MTTFPFKKLFGIDANALQKSVIITPLNEYQLFAPGTASRAHGDYFRVAQAEGFTVIGTHYSLLVGDCVLALAATRCREVFLFGCCGGIGVDIGDKMIAGSALDFGSFPAMLAVSSRQEKFSPDGELTKTLLQNCPGAKAGCCASVSSLALETERLALFDSLGVNCLDMEAASVFAAAASAGIRSAAAFYVSNRVPDKPWHEFLSPGEIKRLGTARKTLAAQLAAVAAR
jgi:hypothetical protein